MGASSLSSRAIIGEFYNTLQQNLGASWIPLISNYFDSNQEMESYKWLGMVPAMREWVGGRQAKGLRENGLDIRNKSFEATLEVLVDEIRRDKTGQVMIRVRELAARANSHWAKLLSAFIATGESSVGYDGQYFYDTDHAEGDSGVQSNRITADVATPAKPTAGEMEGAILAAVQQLLAIKDDQGEPLNEDASQFLVMVPINLMAPAAGALGSQIVMEGGAARSNLILTAGSLGGLDFKLATNARLPWTTKFAVFNTGAEAKALIRQEEEGIKVEAIAEGSELEFKEKKHWYGVSAMRNVGYGYWQRSVLTELT
jgi:phage major head subunit gpT-like protein